MNVWIPKKSRYKNFSFTSRETNVEFYRNVAKYLVEQLEIEKIAALVAAAAMNANRKLGMGLKKNKIKYKRR